MAELFRDENASHENDRELDGVIKVDYQDGTSVTLQTAELQPAWVKFFGKKIPYDLLVNNKGYEIEPYTVFEEESLQNFGDSLVETFSTENTLALQSKRHVLDLGFRAIVGAEYWGGLLDRNINHRHQEDSNDYATDLRMLIDDDGYDLWVRLEERQQFRDAPKEIIMARLAFMSVTKEDKLTMVPIVKTHDGSQTAAIPDSLTFGHPWLYVGTDYNEYGETQ